MDTKKVEALINLVSTYYPIGYSSFQQNGLVL
jgi:hypothetical protein